MTQILKRRFAAKLSTRIAAVAAAAITAWGVSGAPVQAEAPNFAFRTIDGASIELSDLRGAPVLLINTAMQDGYAVQIGGVKELARDYAGKDLTVILMPRDEVKGAVGSPRALSYFYRDLHGLRMPITYPMKVEGPGAHPFFEWLRTQTDERIRWNFNKILLNADGDLERVYGAEVWPTDHRITRMVETRIETARIAREGGETAVAAALPDVAPEAVVAALAPAEAVEDAASEIAVAQDTTIKGEIASAEMWPPTPAPRPETLMREDFTVASGPWPPLPMPRPEGLLENSAAAMDSSARQQFILTSAD